MFGIDERKDYTRQEKRANNYLHCRLQIVFLVVMKQLIANEHISDHSDVQIHSVYVRGMLNSFP